MNHKSLIILGQVKGFTYPVYRYVRKATGLKLPNICEYGELLSSKTNKFWHYPDLWTEYDSSAVDAVGNMLSHYKRNYVLRTTANPYLILEFLNRHPQLFNVLHVYRKPSQCMLAQEKAGCAVVEPDYLDKFFKYPTLYYSNLIYSPPVLWEFLRNLGYPVRSFDYTKSNEFRSKHYSVVSRLCFSS